ncbi:ATP-binding cassette domain-containing protein [Marisediminicola sp. LYQ134]|uniref:ATP-binding cassette domain-containing protein n=1 Tax=Marisediminicola sp. LYQ134 TaxID=3391061 RepID=UPI00398385A2
MRKTTMRAAPTPAYADAIVVRDARTNNLRGIDVDIPKRQLVVFTGVSGSGKSSLAFDTIAAESQRLLTETYPAYLQNQLPHAPRPDVASLQNLTATIAVTQSPMGVNPRSTVGTATDTISLLRQLFAGCGSPTVRSPQALSFNSAEGVCLHCDGTGHEASLDTGRLVNARKSLNEGAIDFPNFTPGSLFWKVYTRSGHFDNDKPIGRFTEDERQMLLHGTGPNVDTGSYPMAYEGVLLKIRRLYVSKTPEALKPKVREALAAIATVTACATCDGTRLNEAARACMIGEHSIATAARLETNDLRDWIATLEIPERLEELQKRLISILTGMQHVGLGYLGLDRPTSTLSGGEAQRIRTVMHLDSALSELTYVFDEPAAGLHAHDTARVVELLHRLRDKGNTVLVVEHHPDVIRAADHVIDVGPGAGAHGGTILFEGTPSALIDAGTPTAEGLSNKPTPKTTPRPKTGTIPVRGATVNNLQDLSLDIPTGCLVAVTGVAGAGKTSLLSSIPRSPDLVALDQSPIRGSRRSSIATFTGALDDIRSQFAKANGVSASLFSPNGAGGCPECNGLGVITTSTPLGDSLSAVCSVCRGRRFESDALVHQLAGRSIADVLDLSVEAAAQAFEGTRAGDILRRVVDVGIGYVSIGQPLTQLSGGERQRLRLAIELRQAATTYVLDEPTTGLHASDVQTLIKVLDGLVDEGATVIVADHNLHLIARADHIIELGPEAGSGGGQLSFQGTPQSLLQARTHTGHALHRVTR